LHGNLCKSILVLLLSLILPSAAVAAGKTALFYNNVWYGNPPKDYLTPALEAKGFNVLTATSAADFNTRLAQGGVTLAICCNSLFAPIDIDAALLAAYVNGGGSAIHLDAGINDTFYDLFQLYYPRWVGWQETNIIEPALAQGVTNPLPLTNPGNPNFATWAVFPTGTAISLATLSSDPLSSSIVSAHDRRTIALGFQIDALLAADGQQFFENLLDYISFKRPFSASHLLLLAQ
jgi:hypothetical protein